MKGLLALVVLPLAIPLCALAALLETRKVGPQITFTEFLGHSAKCDGCQAGILKIYVILMLTAVILVLP